jgi:hypothetical protein
MTGACHHSQLFAEISIPNFYFLLRLALNHDPPDLSLLRTWISGVDHGHLASHRFFTLFL